MEFLNYCRSFGQPKPSSKVPQSQTVQPSTVTTGPTKPKAKAKPKAKPEAKPEVEPEVSDGADSLEVPETRVTTPPPPKPEKRRVGRPPGAKTNKNRVGKVERELMQEQIEKEVKELGDPAKIEKETNRARARLKLMRSTISKTKTVTDDNIVQSDTEELGE